MQLLLLLRVRAAVDGEGAAPSEGAAAVRAGVRLLSRVQELVLEQCAALGEAGFAVLAGVGTFPRVHPLVTDQARGGREALPVWMRWWMTRAVRWRKRRLHSRQG